VRSPAEDRQTSTESRRSAPGSTALAQPTTSLTRLAPGFLGLAAGAGLCTAGLVTFGIISFHQVTRDLVPTAGVPLLYAGAMASGAVTAPVTGEAYARIGGRVLALPVLVSAVVAGTQVAALLPPPAVVRRGHSCG